MSNDVETTPAADDRDTIGVAVCPKCLSDLPPSVDFCPNCRAPVTPFANSGYLESAIAEGWGIGEAIITKRPGLLNLIGLWLIISPVALGAGLFLLLTHGDEWDLVNSVCRVVMAALLGGAAWCLLRGTRNYFRARRNPEVDDAPEPEGTPE